MKKDKKLTVRVSEEEYEVIKLKSDLSGMSMSRFLVEKAKKSYVEGYAQLKKELEEKEKELAQINGQLSIN